MAACGNHPTPPSVYEGPEDLADDLFEAATAASGIGMACPHRVIRFDC